MTVLSNEYQIKVSVPTGSLLPPYRKSVVTVIEANSASDAIKKAKEAYIEVVGFIDSEDYPMNIEEIRKL